MFTSSVWRKGVCIVSFVFVNLLRFGASVLKVHGTSEPIDSKQVKRTTTEGKVHSLCLCNLWNTQKPQDKSNRKIRRIQDHLSIVSLKQYFLAVLPSDGHSKKLILEANNLPTSNFLIQTGSHICDAELSWSFRFVRFRPACSDLFAPLKSSSKLYGITEVSWSLHVGRWNISLNFGSPERAFCGLAFGGFLRVPELKTAQPGISV